MKNNTLHKDFFARIGKLFSFPKTAYTKVKSHNFFFLNNSDQFDPQRIAASSAVIISNTSFEETTQLLRTIRKSIQRNIYLKPIFLETSPEIYASLQYQVDGYFEKGHLPLIKERAAGINRLIKDLKVDATQRDIPSSVLVKTVQFLWTRGEQFLKTYTDTKSSTGYAFSFIHSFFPLHKTQLIEDILAIGVKEEWFAPHTVAQQDKDPVLAYVMTLAGEQLAISGYYEEPKQKKPVLPEGILPLVPFKTLVASELAEVKQKNRQSFLLQLGLIHKNIDFLSKAAQEELALDCLKLIQQNEGMKDTLAFTPNSKLWMLVSDSTEALAIQKAEHIFGQLQQMLRKVLDIDQPLLELNMFKLKGKLPVIQ